MYYEFRKVDSVLRVWMWDDDFHNDVELDIWGESINKELLEDNKGKYFKYEGDKYYINDYYKFSYNDIKTMLDNKERVPSDYITQMVLNENNNNLTILIPYKFLNFNSKSDDLIICKFKDIKGLSYRIKDNYKINVIYKDEDGYDCKREFYTSDLVSLINEGTFILNR